MASVSAGTVRIDDQGLHLPLELTDPVDVAFGDRVVWSILPEREGEESDGVRLVPWPHGLRPYLDGRARIRLLAAADAEVLDEQDVVLGDGQGEIELVNERGELLSVDKLQHIKVAFADAPREELDALLDATEGALTLLRKLGHDAFLAYGNLLGAVRTGKLIGHDNDADIGYLASSPFAVDVIRESMAIERAFQDAGWRTFRMSGGFFKVYADQGGHQSSVDVFSAFWFDDEFHLMPYTVGELPRDTLLPLGTVELEGRTFPAPRDPEAMLEVCYGPQWRVPDPTYKYEPSTAHRRRIGGYMRGERRHVSYWQKFYESKAHSVPTEPSPFAEWVAAYTPRPRALVDIGSGTGRDSLWLAEQGIDVLGCDYSDAGVAFAEARAAERGVDASFRRLNLYDLRQMLSAGALLAHDRATDAVYARFLVHALEDEGRQNLWRFCRQVLRGTRGRVFLEFRTESTQHAFGEHFRKFVQPETVAEELTAQGFGVEHCENRHGLAVHKDEDPRVCRLVARAED